MFEVLSVCVCVCGWVWAVGHAKLHKVGWRQLLEEKEEISRQRWVEDMMSVADETSRLPPVCRDGPGRGSLHPHEGGGM